MARIQLENRLGVTLQRLLFTGRSYTIEPPPTIPPNAVVFWQTDDTGAVTFSVPLAVSGGAASARPSADTAPESAASPIDSGAASTVPASSPRSTATQAASPTPTPAASADRRFTIGWQFSPTGHPTYRTQHVDAGLRVRRRERGDSASYVVSSRRRSKRAPLSPAPRPRRSRIISVAGLLAALLIIATAGAAAAEVYAKTGRLPFGFGGPPHTSTPSGGNATPRIVLTAGQTSVVVGTAVTLTASLEGPFHASGYHIDIVNTATTTAVLNPSPCPVSGPCTAGVTSSVPAASTYVAYLERGLQSGVVASSNAVSVTWVQSSGNNGPSVVTLVANPPPDGSETVRVPDGTKVALTATTDRAVESAHYQITIVDSGSNSPVAPACSKGTSCVGGVISDSPISRTYVAHAMPSDPASSGGRLSSSTITVIWSKSSPNPLPTISLSSSPAANGSGVVQVLINTSVMLTSTSGPVDIASSNSIIRDTSGNRVGGPCKIGIVCSATVTRSSPASVTYSAGVVQISSGQIVKSSNQIKVVWSRPPPPPTISLSASSTSLLNGQYTLLTANAGGSVDNTGYVIQIVDLQNNQLLCQTGSGSSCGAVQFTSNNNTIPFRAFVDQGSAASAYASSNVVSVTWSAPPAPCCISLGDNSSGPAQSAPVTFTATTDRPVDGTGYEIQIYDLTNGALLGTCTTGASCQAVEANPDPNCGVADYTYQAFVDQGSPGSAIASSNQVSVHWNGGIC